jgi:uncharacterized protein YraI
MHLSRCLSAFLHLFILFAMPGWIRLAFLCMIMLFTISLASATTTSVSIADLEVESGSTTAAPVLISSATNL